MSFTTSLLQNYVERQRAAACALCFQFSSMRQTSAADVELLFIPLVGPLEAGEPAAPAPQTLSSQIHSFITLYWCWNCYSWCSLSACVNGKCLQDSRFLFSILLESSKVKDTTNMRSSLALIKKDIHGYRPVSTRLHHICQRKIHCAHQVCKILHMRSRIVLWGSLHIQHFQRGLVGPRQVWGLMVQTPAAAAGWSLQQGSMAMHGIVADRRS